MGGGRLKGGDIIDPSVGYSGFVRLGQKVDKGEPLAMVHAATDEAAEKASQTILSAIRIDGEQGEIPSLIYDRVN